MTENERIAEIKDAYKEAVDGWAHVYDAATDDIKFVYDVDDGQWPEHIRSQREKDGRPVLTVNKLQKTLRRIRGDHKMNPSSIRVLPVDDKADPQVAELYNGIIREIEYLSNASIAYDTAYNHALSSSVGFFRLVTVYEEGDTFEQSIRIKRIVNPMSVHFDPYAQEFSLEDARYCFVEDMLDKKLFKRLYPKAEIQDFDSSSVATIFGDWMQQDKVRVAEYFYKENRKRRIVELRDGTVIPIEKKITTDALKELGHEIVRERQVDVETLRWVKLNGAEILDEGEWPTSDIPIIPMFGDEVVVDGKRYYISLARGAKDPQRMYNYWARLSLETPIPTPSGWTTMGEIKGGDTIFDENGRQCKVLGLSPVSTNRKCYKVSFNNGTSIVADDDHLWTVEELRGKKWETKTIHTKDLVAGKHYIRIAKPLDILEKSLPIPPYVLGLWLTDGDSKRAKVFAGEKTVDELMSCVEQEGMSVRKGMISKSSNTYGLALLGIRDEFSKLNLLGNKHIPQEYLRGSFGQRLDLLQGLMDGDGTCKLNGQCAFAAYDEKLAKGVSELLRSLGFKGTYHRQADGMYVFSFAPRKFPVFRLTYKLKRQFRKRGRTTQSCRHIIESIEQVESVPVRCLKVDSPNSLFLAGEGMIPTHNTAATETVALTPKAPFIIDHRQIKGFENEWDEANRINRMYIRYNAVAGLQKPAREPQGQVPTAIMGMMQATAYDVEDHLGQYESSKGEASNERSKVAIMARVQQSDKGTFLFVDNSTRAKIVAGRQIIKLIPKIYDTKRAMRIRGEDGSEQLVTVNNPVLGPNGEVVRQNDLTVGKYDLIATVGASFSSKRQEMVELMVNAMQYAPMLANAIAPLIFEYSDFPGSKEISEALKRQTQIIQQQQQMAAQQGQQPSATVPPGPPMQ